MRPPTKYFANHMPTDRHETATNKNAAPKGRIKSEWIAELFLQKLFFIMTNSIVAELIAGLYSPVPAWLGPPDLGLAPYSTR